MFMNLLGFSVDCLFMCSVHFSTRVFVFYLKELFKYTGY